MKKITLLMVALLLGVTGVNAEETAVELWAGEQATGDWGANVDLSYNKKGQLSEIFMNDKIRITYKGAGDDATVRVANPNGWEEYEASSQATAKSGDDQTFDYTITSAVILEQIQQNGILGRGKNITITKIELLKVDGRYDAVPVTIGEDGIATFSSSKKLDFSATGIIPYYASAVESGKVTLTAVSAKTTWDYQGYILKGSTNTYDVPVINDAVWPSTNFLKATNDYSAEVLASTTEKYHYIFAKKNATKEIGFYKLTANHTLGAHKAYLETTDDITPGASRVALVFDDGETTGIQELENSSIEELKNSGNEALKAYYNLNGQRVANPRKGLYVVNGKKVIIK